MKFVAATPAALSPRSDDFNYAQDGELLTLAPVLCSTPEARETCGCGRAFSGTTSRRATTPELYRVLDLPRGWAAERAAENSPWTRHEWAED